MALDGATIAAVSVAIALAAQHLVLMSVLVPALLVGRFAAWRILSRPSPRAWRGELGFFAACVALGAFNDWSSVVRHRIYDYTVPVFFPDLSTIPLWMLLFWGMILRFLVVLAAWDRLGAPVRPDDRVFLGPRAVSSRWLKIGLQLALVLGTRQTIYRLYLDPVGSWVPFLVAGLAYGVLFGLDRYKLRLAGLIFIGGPCVEALYIHGGGLHRYHLGWLAGVPLWIALWWVLATLIWGDLGRRLQGRIRSFCAKWPPRA